VQRSSLCRSRRELSNEYLLAKIGADTAENEPPRSLGENYSIIFIRVLSRCMSGVPLPSPGRHGSQLSAPERFVGFLSNLMVPNVESHCSAWPFLRPRWFQANPRSRGQVHSPERQSKKKKKLIVVLDPEKDKFSYDLIYKNRCQKSPGTSWA